MKGLLLFSILLCIVACEPSVFTIVSPAMEATIPQGMKIVINKEILPVRNDVVAFKVDSDYGEFFTFRMVAQPGDTFSISDGLCFINSIPEIPVLTFQYSYVIYAELSLTDRFFEEQKIHGVARLSDGYMAHMTNTKAEELSKVDFIKTIEKDVREPGWVNNHLFKDYIGWNEDQFGKLYIPKSGDKITIEQLSRYRQTILLHEGVDITNLTEYVFKNSYCFVMGDSRHNALDSRFIGLIPMNSVLGKVQYAGPLPSNVFFPL